MIGREYEWIYDSLKRAPRGEAEGFGTLITLF